MSVPPEPPQAGNQPDEQPGDAGATREIPKPAAGRAPDPSPWSRDYAGPAPTYLPPPPPAYTPAPPAYAPPTYQGWPTAPQQGWPTRRSRRGLWAGVTLVAVAIVATLIAVLVTHSSSSTSSASGGTGQFGPNPLPPVVPTPAPGTSAPQAPIPSIGAVATPPGLLAIDYHAYSLSSVAPSDIALGPQELTEFKKDGLYRVVGLRALTLGATTGASDDWDADINVLRFSSPANAVAELNYSNSQNKKSASTIALPGLPNATGFVNRNATTGISIGAFTTVGRYQVVVILSGLSANVPTSPSVVAAEAARVLKAVLPDAATIVPPASGSGGGSGGTGPVVPGFPTPSPTGTHA